MLITRDSHIDILFSTVQTVINDSVFQDYNRYDINGTSTFN